MVELTATAPAKLFGLYPRKGTIAVGSDADVVLFDAGRSHVITADTQHGHCDFTLFEGREVTGQVRKVFLRGELIVDGEQWLGRTGAGEYVPRGESGGW
jgi:dihydropyrimidinase